MSVPDSMVEERLREIFEIQLRISLPKDDIDLIDSGLIDSLTLVELIVNLEEKFDIDLSEAELTVEDFRTVARITQLIKAHAETGSGNTPY